MKTTKNTSTSEVSIAEIQEEIQMFDLTHPLGLLSAIDKIMTKFHLTREQAEDKILKIQQSIILAQQH